MDGSVYLPITHLEQKGGFNRCDMQTHMEGPELVHRYADIYWTEKDRESFVISFRRDYWLYTFSQVVVSIHVC